MQLPAASVVGRGVGGGGGHVGRPVAFPLPRGAGGAADHLVGDPHDIGDGSDVREIGDWCLGAERSRREQKRESEDSVGTEGAHWESCGGEGGRGGQGGEENNWATIKS